MHLFVLAAKVLKGIHLSDVCQYEVSNYLLKILFISYRRDDYEYFFFFVELPPADINPCIPSPCGPNALCQIANKSPSCTCMDNYIGSPPNCRTECTINSDCASNRACINQKCRDPCPGSCGLQTECHVYQHAAVCSCREGFTGNPFQSCYLQENIGKFVYHSIHDFFFVGNV